MVMLDVFQKGDVYIDFPYEDMKFRFEKNTGKVFGRFYGQTEHEIDRSSTLFRDAVSSGELITKEEYYLD